MRAQLLFFPENSSPKPRALHSASTIGHGMDAPVTRGDCRRRGWFGRSPLYFVLSLMAVFGCEQRDETRGPSSDGGGTMVGADGGSSASGGSPNATGGATFGSGGAASTGGGELVGSGGADTQAASGGAGDSMASGGASPKPPNPEDEVDPTPRVATNPIIQTKFTADPAPLVVGDTVYLYTSHDEDDATGFTMYEWLLYSSRDMVNWTDHGVIGGVKEPTKTFAWADGYNAWAPQAILHDDKFYLYCPLVRNGHMDIGVAVADEPTGPFVDAIGAPLIHNPDSIDDIDPSVFVDEDGQAYLYWGHKRLFYVKLNADMISYTGEIIEFERPDLFEEGPWFYRRGDHYYLAFASYCCPEGIGYAMSDSPTGPWTTQGYVMRPNDASSGNHPGIIDFKGRSYVFGFNYALNWAETSEHRERRSICADELTYNADGTIEEVPWWSDRGVTQIAPFNPYGQVEAETIAWSSGVKTEVCSEGGLDVSSIDDGDLIKVSGVNFNQGAVSFSARVASSSDGGSIEIRLDGETEPVVATCSVPNTGGPQEWQTVSCMIEGNVSGFHDLYFTFGGGGFNFNWWTFEP